MTSCRSTIKFKRASKRRVRLSVQKGEGSLHAEGHLKGSVMDKELQISPRTEFLPKETWGSTENSISFLTESYADVGVPAFQQTYTVISLAQLSPSTAFCPSIMVSTNDQLQMHTWFSAPIPH